ncbi:MAG: FAD-binding oxidoreductase [Chloroflexi bacterium]|nr:FAD-binding oxidoreductase [Chloroflexota bacterium]
MTLKETPCWLDTVTLPTFDNARPWPVRVDVAVVGGGYTGLSAARTLAKRGAKVAVLEAQTIGWGASSRNGGMVLTGLKVGASTLIAGYGLETARRLFAASVASIDCVEQIIRQEAIDCDFSRSGHLDLAFKPAHFKAFAHHVELIAREFNHSVRLVPKSELRGEIGSDLYYGGLVDETSAGLNPVRYVAGLARAAEKAGAELHEWTPAERVARESSGFRITTPRGELRAGEVFFATNGYTGSAVPSLQKRIIPIGSYIIATETLPDDLAREVSPRNRMMFDTKNYLYYFRLTPDRRMLFGGRAGFVPATPDTVRESAEILRRAMLSVYPQLRDVKVEYAWGGTLGFTFDRLPHAGKIDGLHYAMGYAGHGVAMATYLGAKMAEIILGGPNENPFEGLPFPTAPLGLYDGNPWFMPLAGWWYRLLDWIS